MAGIKISFFQTFNAMRIYLTSYVKKTNAQDIAILLSGLKLDSSRPNWKEDLWTWDQAMFEDWMDGVHKTLHDLNIKDDPKKVLYNENMAFLCLRNYLQLFYEQIPFDDVKEILKILYSIKQSPEDPGWQHWLACINAAIEQEFTILG